MPTGWATQTLLPLHERSGAGPGHLPLSGDANMGQLSDREAGGQMPPAGSGGIMSNCHRAPFLRSLVSGREISSAVLEIRGTRAQQLPSAIHGHWANEKR